MSYNPNYPQDGQRIDATEIRNQFQGIVSLIASGGGVTDAQVDAISTLPAGTPANATASVDGSTLRFTFALPQGNDGATGGTGPQGLPFASAVVDSVTTLSPGEPASVQTTFDGSNVRFTFGLPRGNDGATGGTGPQGLPFASAVVDSVTTLSPGEPASVQTLFDGSNVRFTFGLPRGADGGQGPPGNDGQQGAPGEVTTGQLASAIESTSSNSNTVSTLGLVISDPPTQAELQQVTDKLDELITALRR